MENLKIRVNSEAENKEAQELFFELGGKPHEKTTDRFGLVIFGNGVVYVDNINFESYYTDAYSAKEITLSELRDLVVLKRNSIDDATHKGNITDNAYYVSSDEEVYRFESSAWCFSTVPIAYLKPIEKPMKEYLRKNSNGTYSYIGTVRPEHVSDFMIEIPKTAELVLRNKQGKIEFFKDKCGSKFENGNWIGVSIPFARLQEGRILFLKGGCQAYWDSDFSKTLAAPFNLIESRHTLPEELPFIDDEPSINDQYAEIEKVRQSHRTASETTDPTIKETLSQRQSQYGSFEDVAMITEQMVDIMRKGYYEKLAYNQKMALYMICSKMARIVNGNPNHKDSWHDIAGYATLIDNELVSEKDMPF